MLVFVIIFVALGGAAIYWWKARQRIWPHVRHLWLDLRHHRVAVGALLLYSALCGVMLVVGFNQALLIVPLALPFIAGACAGWWETRQNAGRSDNDSLIAQGSLAGALAMLLPALFLVIGNLGIAWWTGVLPGESDHWSGLLVELLMWAGGILGLGIMLGALGSYGGTWLEQISGRVQR